jgi:cytochrome c biogenesis protein CcmG/thiol:disulfide interchange protein DsbE
MSESVLGEAVKTKALAAVAILAVIALIAARHWNRRTEPVRGGNGVTHPLAPDFSLTDLNGQTLQLLRYRGKVVLLNFWATWCAPCRSEIPRFVDLQNKYDKQGFEIIGISLDDDPEMVRAFYQQFRMNYPVAIGDAKLAEQYGGILGLPVSFVIGRDGRIYAKHADEADISLIEREINSLL